MGGLNLTRLMRLRVPVRKPRAGFDETQWPLFSVRLGWVNDGVRACLSEVLTPTEMLIRVDRIKCAIVERDAMM